MKPLNNNVMLVLVTTAMLLNGISDLLQGNRISQLEVTCASASTD